MFFDTCVKNDFGMADIFSSSSWWGGGENCYQDDVAFLLFWASFLATFLIIAVKLKALGQPKVCSTVVGSEKGHASCKTSRSKNHLYYLVSITCFLHSKSCY